MKVIATLLFMVISSTLLAKDVTPMCAPETKNVLSKSTRKMISSLIQKLDIEIDTREMGRILVTNLEAKKPKSSIDKNAYDFYRDSEIQLAFSDKNFESIRRGCFKNQFQTNSSKGFASKSKRQKAEKTLIGTTINDDPKVLTNPNDPSHLLRPKYAYFVPTKPMEDVTPLTYSESYGNVYAVMKNEVKDRSTFTAQDSLKVIEEAFPLKTKADYKEVRKNKTAYWETQIWGELCFSDVSHFVVNCSASNKVTDATLAQMKETGIPVYQCKKEKKGVNEIFTKGSPVYAENKAKRKQDESN